MGPGFESLMVYQACPPTVTYDTRRVFSYGEETMIFCAGEILVDMMPAEEKNVYEMKAGGAPFNVACAVKALGKQAGFAGCAGADIPGDFLAETAEEKQFDCLLLARNKKRATTLSFVSHGETGERTFCFYGSGTADTRMPKIKKDVLMAADIIVIGSLMLREKRGVKYAAALAKRAKEAGKAVAFDVNYRESLFKNRRAAADAFGQIITHADIVKFSEDEAVIFGSPYIGRNSEKLICVTMGEKGSKWYFRGKTATVPVKAVVPVDTTGAGDAFFAAVLSKLDGVSKSTWSDEFLNDALLFGNCAGALNTLGKGAIDFLPSLRQIEELKKTIEKN